MQRILYVDDDEANLEVLRAACEDEFDVVTASSGARALDLMRDQEFAVLLADQRMPGMTGVELLERVRDIAPDTIRILITAYSDITDAIAAINRGHVRRYLRKPWDPDELKATLHDAAEMFSSRRRLERLEQQLRDGERVYSLGLIAAGIAHELRNPLSVLTARLGLARSRIEKLREGFDAGTATADLREHLDKVAEFVDLAGKAGSQIVEIVEGVELGHRRRDEERVADLRDVVRRTVRTVRGTLIKRAVLDLDEGDAVWVRGSSTQLGQVALNLLVNALQALPEDRPRSDNRVSVRIESDDPRVRLLVDDNGPGVPADARERIFDTFFTTKKEGGTGLGLPISRRIVEELGGSLTVGDAPGGGARFVVELVRADVDGAR